jgi:uncharacterized protein YktA (UPF0223 family)
MYTYPIDYDLFNAEEVSIIVGFLSFIEDANEKKVDSVLLSTKHQKFRKVVNSISMEKKIDREFMKVSGYSIYKTLKKYK